MRHPFMLILLLFLPLLATAQEVVVRGEVFADPLEITKYDLNLSYDVRADSVDLGTLPRLAFIERVIAVVDSQLMQFDSLRLTLRDGQQPLLVLTAVDAGEVEYQAGTIWQTEPVTTTGASEDRLVLHFHSPAFMDGHMRLFVMWRRLF